MHGFIIVSSTSENSTAFPHITITLSLFCNNSKVVVIKIVDEFVFFTIDQSGFALEL